MKKENKAKVDFKVLGRVIGYITKNYKFQMIVVIICIILSTISSVVRKFIFGKIN